MKQPAYLPPKPELAAAWQRSLAYGVDPHRMPQVEPLPVRKLQERILGNAHLLEAALPFVDHLYQTVESECIVAICDRDGILLATRGERLPDRLLMHHTTPGVCWGEHVFGANALGTSLVEDRPIHMVGEEHFLIELHGMTCAATPLHDEEGHIVGGIAIAAYKAEHSPYMLGTVLSSGHAIEKAMVLKSEHYHTLLLQQKIIELSNHAILVTDAQGQILHINQAAEEMFDVSSAGTLSEIFCEKTAPLVSLRERRNFTDFLDKHQHAGNGEMHIYWDTQWLEQGGHDTDRLLLIARDMTKFFRLERTIQQAERLSTMGKFSAQIAHEIRNPIAVIKLAMQLLLSQEDFSEKSEKKGQMILHELRRIEDLVNHFLDISKPQHPQISDCQIVDLLRDTCQLMQSTFLQANLRLLEQYEDVGGIQADCDQLHQVFLNLLRNAVDATPSGGQIEVRVMLDEADANVVCVRVSDTGQGIPQDRLQDIFEPFYTTKSRGTGLGLANAKAIIEAHGGDMEVESRVDCGTVISIWLPKAPPNPLY